MVAALKVVQDGAQPGAQYAFRPMAEATIPDPPIQNTWYTVLNANNVYLTYLAVRFTHSTGAARIVQTRFTVDGQTITGSVGLNHNTVYYAYLVPFLFDTINYQTAPILVGYNVPWYAKSMKIEVRVVETNVLTLDASARWWTL